MIKVKDQIKEYFNSIIRYKKGLELLIKDTTTPADKLKQYKKELSLIPTEFYCYIKNETHIQEEIYSDGCYIVPTTLKSFQKICSKYDHAGFRFLNVLYISQKDFERGYVIWESKRQILILKTLLMKE